MNFPLMLRISLAAFVFPLTFTPLVADVTGCSCDPAQPQSIEKRECSLTREALQQAPGTEVFFLKDVNPRKPNRWLALPAGSGPTCQFIEQMPRPAQLKLWKSAVAKAEELFGNDWALAYNGVKVRTQCHFHIHMGRFIKAAEQRNFKLVRSLAEIPVPPGKGVWVHPVAKGVYHVHAGEDITETALVR